MSSQKYEIGNLEDISNSMEGAISYDALEKSDLANSFSNDVESPTEIVKNND
jgi:hypothetical protein